MTGGTGDVSPQILTMAITMDAANTYKQTEIPLPINRFREKGKRVVVVEALKVYWDLGEFDANNIAGGNVGQITAQLSTASQTGYNPNFTQVFATASKCYRGAFTAGQSYQSVLFDPFTLDLTDGAGHGILLATDNIFLGITTINFVAASAATAKLLYRFKEVSLEEYIGIVQSQQ